MRIRPAICLLAVLLAACATAGSTDSARSTRPGQCLYAIEMEYGLMTKWDSCTQPPANAVRCLNCDSRPK